MYADMEYLGLLRELVDHGNSRSDRTGTGTRSLFVRDLNFDLRLGFPMLTTKAVHFPSVVTELLWFLRGDTNTKFLKEHKCRIWNAWETPDGEIGPMYGKQWRRWSGKNTRGESVEIDQISTLIDNLVRDPNSRRHVVSAWNVNDLPRNGVTPQGNAAHGYMALAPCHHSFQCYVIDGFISMSVEQRSADVFLGVPFNIASYALLLHMIAQVTGLKPARLLWRGGDCHLYNDHVTQAEEQLGRWVRGEWHSQPTLWLDPTVKNLSLIHI